MAIRQVARRDDDGQWLVEMVIEKLRVETVELRIPQLPVLRAGGAPSFQAGSVTKGRGHGNSYIIYIFANDECGAIGRGRLPHATARSDRQDDQRHQGALSFEART